ncbi:MAG: hypothetical protein VR64_14115, partial [Desulfatitalea sp. BRH_c12]
MLIEEGYGELFNSGAAGIGGRMVRSFTLPDLGEGVHEGEVRAVLVTVGQQITEGDPILEVETDKATVEIPSPYTGTVTEVKVQAGDIVHVGDVMIVFDEEKMVRPVAPEPRAEARQSPPSASHAPVPASPAT